MCYFLSYSLDILFKGGLWGEGYRGLKRNNPEDAIVMFF